jgi:ABC-type glutathione transport system ATPase component
MPFKPFINSIGHTTLSQEDNQADDELNNVDLDIPILPEHLQSSYHHGYSASADRSGLERVEEHDMLGHGLGVWDRAKALESERDLEERKDQATEHHRRSRRRRRKVRLQRSLSPSSRSGRSSNRPESSHHPDSSRHPESSSGHYSNAQEGTDERVNGSEKKGGWFSSLFECKLPYAFPRAYPDDESEDEEAHVRPPPVVPHRSGPSCSHPILDQEIEARGQNVSGGFAQSIALARIFVRHDTKILILDEAMSQMDAYKKREIIYPRLFEFTRKFGIALIIITHDLLSIQDVDHVFVLDQGRLVHQGTHNDLLAQRAEVYMRLLGM